MGRKRGATVAPKHPQLPTELPKKSLGYQRKKEDKEKKITFAKRNTGSKGGRRQIGGGRKCYRLLTLDESGIRMGAVVGVGRTYQRAGPMMMGGPILAGRP